MRKILIFTLLFFNFKIFAHRIVSTLPSITEMLYFLELESQVVGVTPFCLYPKKARAITKTGTALALNYEKLIKVKPSIILLGNSASKNLLVDLERMKIRTEVIHYERLGDITKSLRRLNYLFSAHKTSKILSLEKRMNRTYASKNKKVLIVIGETIKNGYIVGLNVATNSTFYGDILKNIGLKNAIKSNDAQYIHINLERLLKLDFDDIIRIGDKSQSKRIKRLWKTTSFKNKIKFLLQDFAVIPGPRIHLLINEMRRLL